ncbi:MAG: hypothetical protein L0I24_13490, partial [Pseudonocardia sp.]|nr:hypothetical protein [Pseudonocardia sp.]
MTTGPARGSERDAVECVSDPSFETTWSSERTAGSPPTTAPTTRPGRSNEITAAGVVAAVGPVRAGRVHVLAHVLHADVPALPG